MCVLRWNWVFIKGLIVLIIVIVLFESNLVMWEVELCKCVDLWWDVVYFVRCEDEDYVIGCILDYENEDYLDLKYGIVRI